jgi:hypothetical protein
MVRYVYNVKVRGHSVGLTFKRGEAEQWKKDSGGDAVIIAVPYRVL